MFDFNPGINWEIITWYDVCTNNTTIENTWTNSSMAMIGNYDQYGTHAMCSIQLEQTQCGKWNDCADVLEKN